MYKTVIPDTITGFKEYVVIAYLKAAENLESYGITPSKFAIITTLYNDYITKENAAANPDTATKGARDARDKATKDLLKAWRQFLNESIKFNTLVSLPDKEVFGIFPGDDTRTPAKTPTDTGNIDINRLGAYEYEVIVIDAKTLKRKLPPDATGSYIYLTVSEPGVVPEDLTIYRKLDFSSNARHILDFTPAELGKQANVFARYSNRHGQEGPIGPIETFLIN